MGEFPPITSTASLEASERALIGTGLLDTPPEEVFDRFTRLAAKIIGVPVVLMSLVDSTRQFFKSQTGLPEPWASLRGTPLSHSFCQHVVVTGQPLVVHDARQHGLLKDNLAIRDLSVVAYAGIPLTTPAGHTVGSFCAIDNKPRDWTADELEILRSLADAVSTEIDLRAVAAELQANYIALRQSSLLRDELAHMLVHDLRTPLNSLLGGLQGLQSLLPAEGAESEMVKISLRGGRSLAALVDNILDVSRSDAQKLEPKFGYFQPAVLFERVEDQVSQLAAQKGIYLTMEAHPETPSLYADLDLLDRVLVNLLGNAIQHTSKGGAVKVDVTTLDDSRLLLRVIDSGSGIPKADFKRIFEKFGQSSHSNKLRASSGLGLTFCKMVVEAHGGSIWVDSQMGVGTIFSVTLPLRREELIDDC